MNDRQLERALPGEIRSRQQERMRAHLAYACANSSFYRRRFQDAGLDPDILTLEDLSKLPFTSKEEVENNLSEFQAAGANDIADLCLTSGTTGAPLALPQSRQDLERLAYNEEMGFRTAGVGEKDRVLIAAAIDRCFMAGLAYFLGVQKLGATALRGGSSSLSNLQDMVLRQHPTAMVGVPSLLLALGRKMKAEGIEPSTTSVERLVCIGEPVRQADLSSSRLGATLEALWRVPIFGTYASTEMATAFTECEKGQGGHLRPELIVLELVDEAGRSVPDGELGEVVVTPLGVTGLPLIRFRTGDLARLHTSPCDCGRNTPRLGPVEGRLNQRLKVRGTTLYPPAIALALQQIDGVQGHYVEVRNGFDLSDEVRVFVGTTDPFLTPERLTEAIAGVTRVSLPVELVSPEAVQRRIHQENCRKPVTFFDLRSSFPEDDHHALESEEGNE